MRVFPHRKGDDLQQSAALYGHSHCVLAMCKTCECCSRDWSNIHRQYYI